MSKPAKLVRAKPKLQGANVPVGDKDTVTISVLDNSTPPQPYIGPLTSSVTSATSSDTTTLTTDPPSGMTYDEHFTKAGVVTVAIVVTFSDGSTLTMSDTVTITGSPGSLVATHSLPVAGP